jgi:hypothetical protein
MKPAHLFSVAILLGANSIVAQVPLDSAPQTSQPAQSVRPDSPPTRVARLNWLSGDVAFQPAGLEDWTDATLNFPLTTSDHLVTGKDGRAELHIGPNAIRLDANSNFGFLNLDDSIAQVSLTEGAMQIRLNRLDDDDSFEIATPNGAVTLLRNGDYRIDTDPDRDATMLTVRSGLAELFAGGASMLIRSQETAYFRENQEADVRTANDKDDFDSFTATREGTLTTPMTAAASSPVSDEVTGAEDLSAYGSWQTVPGYGDVWVPPVDADWAPYSNGDWAWVDPWGWTWIDAAPWGFAPFHYGRWTYARNHWVWVPDPRIDPVVYAPSLVAFYGGGGSGVVSWYPLGPREVYNPPWGKIVVNPNPAAWPQKPSRSPSNQASPGAVQTLSEIDFAGGSHVRPSVALFPQGQPLGSTPSLAPTRSSVLAGTARLRPPVASRPLVARTAPPPPAILFTAKQSLLAQNHGHPLAASQVEALRRQAPYAMAQGPVVRYSKPLVYTPRVVKTAAARPAPVH